MLTLVQNDSSKNEKSTSLTKKQKQFCEEYLKIGEIKAASKKADCSYNYGWGILQREDCQVYLKSITNIFKKDVEIFNIQCNIDWKLKKLRRVVDEFIKDEGGLDEKQAKVGIHALSEMNKIQGHYAPEKQVTLNIDLKEISDEVETLRLKYKNVF